MIPNGAARGQGRVIAIQRQVESLKKQVGMVMDMPPGIISIPAVPQMWTRCATAIFGHM